MIDRPRWPVVRTAESRPDGSSLEFEIEFIFEARDDKTLMTMIQRGLPTAGLRDEHRAGVPPALARLEHAIGKPPAEAGADHGEKGKGRPEPAHVARRVMQSPGSTDVPFKYRGWVVDFDAGPERDRFQLEEAQNAGALLLGRVTYEAMHAFWPTADGEFADRLNELPKYVVSSTLTDPPWNATVLGDDWPREVARLRKALDGECLRQPPPLAGTESSWGWWTRCAYWSTGCCSVPAIAYSGTRRTRSPAPGRLASVRGGVVNMTYAPATAAG